MKPVDQTRFGAEGNCLQAGLATLLGLPLADVPDFCNGETEGRWFQACNDWLAQRGLSLEFVRGGLSTDAYCLASFSGARGIRHSAVWQGRAVVHDPHPSRADLGRQQADYWFLLVPLRPWEIQP